MAVPMRRTRARRPPVPSSRDVHLPAPVGGLNAISPATAMPFSDCLLLYNMLAAEEGLRVRLGNREWCTGLTGTDTNEVRTILPFTGSASNGSKNKLFACTEDGIWDVTDSSAAPTKVLDFDSKGSDSGWGVGIVTANASGHFLLYADEENGYIVYTETTNLWAKVASGSAAGQLSVLDPRKVVNVNVWGGRVWLTEKDTANAYYLDTGSIYGAASVFPFGTGFRAGGHLVGLFNWTLDGGSGIDDALVAISSGGDVVIYQGTDPAQAFMFNRRGAWFVGAVPYGRRIATNFGGDLLILSSLGILPLSNLVAGANIADTKQYLTHKITPLVTSLMATSRNLRGWSMRLSPLEHALMVTVPTQGADANGLTQPTTQLVYSLASKSWSVYGPGPSSGVATRGLPMFSAEIFDGKLYFGTVDGKVCVNDGYVDGVTLANPNAFADIEWSLISGFSNMDNARKKMVDLIRPAFLAGTDAPSYSCAARYDLDQTELTAPSAPAGGSSTWDTGVWDSAVWGADQQAVLSVLGSAGIGVHVAIAARGKARSRTILAGFDIVYRQGGVL